MRLITIILLSFLTLRWSIGQGQEKPNNKNTVIASDSLDSAPNVDSSTTTEISNAVALNYKEATSLLGKTGKDTAIYVFTAKPSRGTYCIFFRTKFGAFNQIISSSESDKMIESILNGEPYAAYTDSKYLFLATDQNFKNFDVIDEDGMLIGQKRYILVITNNRPKKLIKASKK